jgi:fumarylacetoacetate (FAA) hydrolase
MFRVTEPGRVPVTSFLHRASQAERFRHASDKNPFGSSVQTHENRQRSQETRVSIGTETETDARPVSCAPGARRGEFSPTHYVARSLGFRRVGRYGGRVKLGTLPEGGRDGTLVVVSRDLRRAARVGRIARTLQATLDDWARLRQQLEKAAAQLEQGVLDDGFSLDIERLAAPLPRAFQFADGSAYLNHVELVRRARGAEIPASLRTDPLMYQAVSDHFLAPTEPIRVASEDYGVDLEAEVAVVTDDVPMGVSPGEAKRHVVLVVLVNDVSLRNLIPAELSKGFGFFHGKPPSALSPLAVTPDELGAAWDGERLALELRSSINGRLLGRPNAAVDMHFSFAELIAHAAKTRPLAAGTIIGSGTVSNVDRSVGSSCLAEVRTIETIDGGAAKTAYLRFGDVVRIEMLDTEGRSIFGAIEQRVERA